MKNCDSDSDDEEEELRPVAQEDSEGPSSPQEICRCCGDLRLE